MKKMSCIELGGDCDFVLTAETCEGMIGEMYNHPKGKTPHLVGRDQNHGRGRVERNRTQRMGRDSRDEPKTHLSESRLITRILGKLVDRAKINDVTREGLSGIRD
jgi:hypothetical protein